MFEYLSTIGLVNLPLVYRRLFFIGIDALLLLLAVWFSFWLRLAHPFHPSFLASGTWLMLVILLVGLPLYAFSGQYKALLATQVVLPSTDLLPATDC